MGRSAGLGGDVARRARAAWDCTAFVGSVAVPDACIGRRGAQDGMCSRQAGAAVVAHLWQDAAQRLAARCIRFAALFGTVRGVALPCAQGMTAVQWGCRCCGAMLAGSPSLNTLRLCATLPKAAAFVTPRMPTPQPYSSAAVQAGSNRDIRPSSTVSGVARRDSRELCGAAAAHLAARTLRRCRALRPARSRATIQLCHHPACRPACRLRRSRVRSRGSGPASPELL